MAPSSRSLVIGSALGLAVATSSAQPARAEKSGQTTRATAYHSKDDLETRLREHLGKVSGIDIRDVADDDDILALGGHSVEVVEQLNAAMKTLGITVPREKVLLRQVSTISKMVDVADKAQRGQL